MPQDAWLIWLMLWIDIALILSVALTAYFSFPKPLSEIMNTNRIRLDGTKSDYRSAIESAALSQWRNNVLFCGLLALLIANCMIFGCHRFIMPLPIAAAGLEKFDVDASKWKENLQDPEQGNVVGDLKKWQSRAGRAPSPKWMAAFYLVYGLVFALIIAAVGALIRAYIYSLVNLAKHAKKRKNDYLLHDMKSRLEAVETANTPI